MNKIELLMPAGDFDKMKFAFEFGADAVYLGIPRFSLRARENGFVKGAEIEAVRYAHELGKKAYMTANIIPHNRKVEPFIKYVGRTLEQCRPDAWIMADPGIIMQMKEKYPEQKIHLSVQANTVNYAAARFWQEIGVSRVILSRELSIKEISQIRDYCPGLELEVFLHGSICIAYSGRCLISNYMSYRDSNQGTCAHSCRWKYKIYKKEQVQPPNWRRGANSEEIALTQHGDEYMPLRGDYYLAESERPGEFMQIDEDENGTYLMNSRDLCAIEYLDALRDAGVNSFKVEGRSKSIYYAALIARTYRRAIDDMYAGRIFNPEHMRDIFATANRGLISGFLTGNPGRSAQNFDRAKPENSPFQFSGIVRGYDEAAKMLKVEPKNPIHVDMTLELLTKDNTIPFTVDSIINQKNMHVDSIHGGLHYCWIPYPDNPGEFALLREKLHDFNPEKIQLSRDIPPA